MKNSQASPLIGIMTAQKANGTIAGNGLLFTELQKRLISVNGISFIFTLEGVEKDGIYGYLYHPMQNRWIKDKFPFPDLVYNRIPFRKTEMTERCQSFFTLLKVKQIPFFNPCFLDKKELYEWLKHHPLLKRFLPKTILVSGKVDLFQFFSTHSSIYLKPAHSSRGKGIFRLKQAGPKEILLEGIKGIETFQEFDDFWERKSGELLGKTYLAQVDIQPKEFEGKRFDFRILAHAIKDDYAVTGIGIRQSQEQDVTTHIPSGGRLLPYDSLKSAAHDQFIATIVPEMGKALSEQFGFFGEFSIDAGVSKTGKYYIYEVNSKPMSFDEPEIEARRIDRLCSLFLQLASTQNGVV